MTFWVAVRGTVHRAPESIEDDRSEAISAFLLADAQYGRHGDQFLELDDVSVCEVVLRGRAADAALRKLKIGDSVVALGLLRIAVPVGITDDAELVTLTVEAYSIGHDLAGRAPR